ncbi:N-formylglutamate amidohydrolase [Tessaracoccus sp. OS52]|uniref:N-formylglutamate amidohydrolase n=1 Tax=Tessaracoccus sp. OS52 TaxID=2886691 RepID=UPI001D1285AD|nr:N-formylglutamate amidohydrolase [Tessaracoccus sp. OS52]MCC2593864.1 N-formylglutamate amidohydrolase [Tessaracoccus sp. OS52]
MDPFEFVGNWDGQIIATSVHAGHDLRPEVQDLMVLDEATRLREEDPFTDRIAAVAPARVVVHRSRFETDLNRIREKAVYRTPEDCWGLHVWRTDPLPDDVVTRSLEVYDSYFAELARHLDKVAERGPFVLFDVHSYNHRRPGPDEPDEPLEENPEINLGTESVDGRFAGVIEAFRSSMQGQGFDVRENIKFKGQNMPWWVHERYPGVGCVLALEFKKTFMDEWTGRPDLDHINRLGAALAETFDPVQAALAR